ncbi:unnamed protein product [Amoebophrya sp. A25]|nr:unnamed protein product [Amoebophrya sp. A25]|eukprot:GSA25T00009036001.1
MIVPRRRDEQPDIFKVDIAKREPQPATVEQTNGASLGLGRVLPGVESSTSKDEEQEEKAQADVEVRDEGESCKVVFPTVDDSREQGKTPLRAICSDSSSSPWYQEDSALYLDDDRNNYHMHTGEIERQLHQQLFMFGLGGGEATGGTTGPAPRPTLVEDSASAAFLGDFKERFARAHRDSHAELQRRKLDDDQESARLAVLEDIQFQEYKDFNPAAFLTQVRLLQEQAAVGSSGLSASSLDTRALQQEHTGSALAPREHQARKKHVDAYLRFGHTPHDVPESHSLRIPAGVNVYAPFTGLAQGLSGYILAHVLANWSRRKELFVEWMDNRRSPRNVSRRAFEEDGEDQAEEVEGQHDHQSLEIRSLSMCRWGYMVHSEDSNFHCQDENGPPIAIHKPDWGLASYLLDWMDTYPCHEADQGD